MNEIRPDDCFDSAEGCVDRRQHHDGDGRADIAVFRPGTGVWYAFRSSDNIVNILNFGLKEIRIGKLFIPLVIKNRPIAVEPKFQRPVNVELVTLPPLSATMDDCCKLAEMIKADEQLKIGFLEIVSPVELEVVAVYTVSNLEQTNPVIEVVQVQGKNFLRTVSGAGLREFFK